MDIGTLAATLSDLVSILPVMLYAMQWTFYIFLVWFLGSVSMKGYRKQKSFAAGVVATLLVGTICLIGGIAFSGFVPFLNGGIFSIMQLGVIIAGLPVSIALAVSLRLMTHRDRDLKPGEIIDSLKRKVTVLETQLDKKARPMTVAEARRKAEEALPGYESRKGRRVGSEWEIELKKGEHSARVIMDAWDGEIKKVEKDESELAGFFRDPLMIAGLAVIVAVIIGSAVFFEGFPDPVQDFTSVLGISMEELANLSAKVEGSAGIIDNTEPGCVKLESVMIAYQSELQDINFLRSHIYTDDATSRLVESSSNDVVMGMFMVAHEGHEVVLAFTQSQRVCYLTDGKFCGCT